MPYLDRLRRDVTEFVEGLGKSPDFYGEMRWHSTIRITAYKNPSHHETLSKELLGQRNFSLLDYDFDSTTAGLFEMSREISKMLYPNTQEENS